MRAGMDNIVLQDNIFGCYLAERCAADTSCKGLGGARMERGPGAARQNAGRRAKAAVHRLAVGCAVRSWISAHA